MSADLMCGAFIPQTPCANIDFKTKFKFQTRALSWADFISRKISFSHLTTRAQVEREGVFECPVT